LRPAEAGELRGGQIAYLWTEKAAYALIAGKFHRVRWGFKADNMIQISCWRISEVIPEMDRGLIVLVSPRKTGSRMWQAAIAIAILQFCPDEVKSSV